MAALYFHIPFCPSKCAYCNFFSTAGSKHVEGFSAMLTEELALRQDYLGTAEVHSIYFGGGTPSVLPVADIDRIIAVARKLFRIAPEAEITLEANPDHLSSEYIYNLYQTGVNRISVGIQSLDDEALQYLGRSHDAKTAVQALEILQKGPIRELSVDLIFGVPGRTAEVLGQELEFLISRGIPHISAYALTVEEKTPLWKFIQRGKRAAPSESQVAEEFLYIMEGMQNAGYEHYEISNYCLPGHHSRHNSSYWDGTPYLGVGPSAHSFDGQSRQWNVASLEQYLDGIRNGRPLFEKEVLTDIQRLNEYIMTSLRTSRGMDLDVIRSSFGEPAAGSVERELIAFIRQEWVVQRGPVAFLTQQGNLFADRIAAALFQEEAGSA